MILEVVLGGEKVKGMISEQDYTRRVILKDLDSEITQVDDIMTKQVCSIKPEQSTSGLDFDRGSRKRSYFRTRIFN